MDSVTAAQPGTVALRQSALAQGVETGAGAQLLRLAQRVSRRDLETQLYLLELRAREGNIEESLRHYDALLLSRPETSSMLLGILARGLGDRDLRKALAEYAGRDWVINLIRRSTASRGLIGFGGSDQVEDGFEIIIGGHQGRREAVEQVGIPWW